MGFFDSLGEIIGELLGNGMAKMSQIQKYKKMYEELSDSDVKRELNALQGRYGEEARQRMMALQMILKDRNLLQ